MPNARTEDESFTQKSQNVRIFDGNVIKSQRIINKVCQKSRNSAKNRLKSRHDVEKSKKLQKRQ